MKLFGSRTRTRTRTRTTTPNTKIPLGNNRCFNNGIIHFGSASTALLCALLVVVVTAAHSVAAEPVLCGSLAKGNCQKDPNCYWLMSKKKTKKKKSLRHRGSNDNDNNNDNGERCVTALTDEECSEFTHAKKAKRNCKRNRCQWNKEDKTCSGSGFLLDFIESEPEDDTGDDKDTEKDTEKDTDTDTDTDKDTEQEPHNGILDPEGLNVLDPVFVNGWMGTNGSRAKSAFDDKYVLLCSYDVVLSPECVGRDDDPSRIKIMVDGATDEVVQLFDDGVFSAEFAESLEGRDGRTAKADIEARFVVLCSSCGDDDDTRCLARNTDENRIRLMVDADNLVEQVVFG